MDPKKLKRRIALSLIGLLGSLALLTARGAGGAEFTLETSPDSAIVMTLREIQGDPLDLDAAMAWALENATDVLRARAVRDAAQGEVRREKGAFDPEIFADIERSGDDQSTASPFAGADVLETEETSVTAGTRITLPFGTELEASLETTRLETNSAFAALNPEHRTIGRLEVRQPILKGFGPAARSGLTESERRFESAHALYDDAVLGVRADVESGYWELYAAERDLAVRILIVDRAGALLEQARLKADAGLVGPNQVANAKVFLAEQRLALIDQEERLDGISDQLASLLGRHPESGTRFHAADEPPADFVVEPFDSLTARALRRNHKLQSARDDLRAAHAVARGAAWNAYPTLDLVGSVGGNGLSGAGRDVVFGSDTLRTGIDGGFGDTWDQVLNRDFPTWSVGLVLSVPIGFREGRGERDRLRAEALRARHDLLAMQRQLEEDVRAAHRELLHGSRRLGVAREGLEAALEQVRIGLIEYENGRTTAFEVVRLGADLTAAQQRLSEALVRTARAAARLRYLTAEESAQSASYGGLGE